MANLGEMEHAPLKRDPIAVFGEGEGVVATLALIARIAGVPTHLQTAEEGLLRPFHAQDHVLQDVRVHLGKF